MVSPTFLHNTKYLAVNIDFYADTSSSMKVQRFFVGFT